MNGDNHIIVEGWSPRFASAVDALLGIEGGFVDDPVDRGGATKYGWSLRTLIGAPPAPRWHAVVGDGRISRNARASGELSFSSSHRRRATGHSAAV